MVRQAVVSQEDKGQQEVGVGGTCNNKLSPLYLAHKYKMHKLLNIKLTESQQNQKTREIF